MTHLIGGMADDQDEQQLFVLTKRVREALDIINSLDESKMTVIIKRLVRNVGEKGAPFTTVELEQLQEHLQLSDGQVSTPGESNVAATKLVVRQFQTFCNMCEHQRAPANSKRHAFTKELGMITV